MSHMLYVDPQLETHRYEVRVGVNRYGKVQADAIARCVLDIDGRQVRAMEAGKDGVSLTLADADVTALQTLVDVKLVGKTMDGKGRIEFWVKDAAIEQGRGTGPWFHYREKVEASGLAPERHEARNPVLPADTIPYAGIQAAVVDAVNSAIA